MMKSVWLFCFSLIFDLLGVSCEPLESLLGALGSSWGSLGSLLGALGGLLGRLGSVVGRWEGPEGII